MAQKSETVFTNLLRKHLDPALYVEKTSNRWLKGVPDLYIEGPRDILWVEVKHILVPWTTNKTPDEICKTSSWPAQKRWLMRAHENQKQAYVIVGIGSRKNTLGYILDFPYDFNYDEDKERSIIMLTSFIEEKCNYNTQNQI